MLAAPLRCLWRLCNVGDVFRLSATSLESLSLAEKWCPLQIPANSYRRIGTLLFQSGGRHQHLRASPSVGGRRQIRRVSPYARNRAQKHAQSYIRETFSKNLSENCLKNVRRSTASPHQPTNFPKNQNQNQKRKIKNEKKKKREMTHSVQSLAFR